MKLAWHRILVCTALAPLLVPASLLWAWRQHRAMRDAGRSHLWPVMSSVMQQCARGMIVVDAPVVPWTVVSANTERYLASFRGPKQWRIPRVLLGLEFLPWFYGRSRFSRMNEAQVREFCETALSGGGFLGKLGRIKQLARLAYYTEPAAQTDLGFVAFPRRGRSAPRERQDLVVHELPVLRPEVGR